MRAFSDVLLLPLFLLALGLFAQLAHAQGVTFVGSAYEVNAPDGIVAADFNCDGRLDLATAGSEPQDLSIMLGNGDGTFGAETRFAITPSFEHLGGIVAREFNGDSNLDLAVANLFGNTVSILLGNGDGTFGAHTDFITGTGPQGIAVADFNGDGKPDLVTANTAGNDISILLGQGGGVFATPVDFPTGLGPTEVVVGDFNGDGKEDVAVPARQSDAVSILLGNGDGTFGPSTDFSTGIGPASLAQGDFNGDGILDLVTANFIADSASILLGNGDGTFSPRTDLETITNPDVSAFLQVTAADFNADGKLDFLTAGVIENLISAKAGLVLRLGNGDGTFSNNFRLGSMGSPSGIALGDFNADGRIDLAITDPINDAFNVFLQGAVALDQASLDFGLQPPGTSSSPHTVTAQNTGLLSVNIGSVALAGADGGQFSITGDACSGTSIPSGSGCTITVVFSPTTRGRKSVSLVVSHNAFGSPHNGILTGVGGAAPFDFGASPAPLTVAPGESAPFTIEVQGQPGFSAAVSFSCSSGVPRGAVCTFNPASVSPGGGAATTTLTVTTTPRNAVASLASSAVVFASLLMPLGLFFAPRITGLGILLLMVGTMVACGGGSEATSNSSGTPTGMYTIEVTGTSVSTSRTQNVTLVVS